MPPFPTLKQRGPPQRLHEHEHYRSLRPCSQLSPHKPRMHGNAHNVRVPLCHPLGEQNVRELALPVALPHGARVGLLEHFKLDPARRSQRVPKRTHGHEARIAPSSRIGHVASGAQHQRSQEPQEHRVPEIIGPELHLKPFGGEASRDSHDARVRDQDVEAGGAELVGEGDADIFARG